MSFKTWVITPKSELKKSLGSRDWSFLLTESVTFYGGNAFGHHFTGEGFFLMRTIPDVGMSLEEGRTEWIKILYLSSIVKEYEDNLNEVDSLIGKVEISSTYFDKWWIIEQIEDNFNVDDAFNLDEAIVSRIKPSKNTYVNSWINAIRSKKT